MEPLVRPGDVIYRDQILASVVPVYRSFPFGQVTEKYYLDNLSSPNLSDRYGASKALSRFSSPHVREALVKKLQDDKEHIYVRLETAASLARLGDDEGYQFIRSTLNDAYLRNVLEAVIVLSEIRSETSCRILSEVLKDENRDPEIRAGAAWGLGELNEKAALDSLVESFTAVDETIRIEAARALAKLTADFGKDVIAEFRKSPPSQRTGIAWALAKAPEVGLDDLLSSLGDQDSREWISYIVGMRGQRRYIEEIEKLKRRDPEVYFAVTVLWKIMTSWIYNLNEY